MVHGAASRCAIGNDPAASDGWFGLPVGRRDEIRLPQSRCRSIYKARVSGAAFYGNWGCVARDHRRCIVDRWTADAAGSDPVCYRNARRDGVKKDPDVSGNLSAAFAAGAATSWLLGG